MEVKMDASFGVVPIYEDGRGGREYLLVKHRKGHWGFPKGHADEGETMLETAKRELAEETGICDVDIDEEKIFEEYYEYISKKGKLIRKTVTYYVGVVHEKHVTSQGGAVEIQEAELLDAQWGDEDWVRERMTFREGVALFDEVFAYLEGMNL
ncbi:NUDIX domain-containing protein [Planctomycetota bacterium]|nr:NUDIX domain-containing protein [Planctomycetota bacterium]